MNTHYEISGTGETVTLIHGVGADSSSWARVTPVLEEHFRVLRYDLRGHGRSKKPPGPYQLDDFVGELRMLLDNLVIEQTHLVGFSLGGLVAQAFALAHPLRADKLVFLSTVANRSAEEKASVIKRAENLEHGRLETNVSLALERWFSEDFRKKHPERVEQRLRKLRCNDPRAYAAAYRVFAESDLGERLHRLTQPTLIATGEHDPGSSARMARFMHAQIAGSRLEILPELRHSILVEAPELVARHLQEFLAPR